MISSIIAIEVKVKVKVLKDTKHVFGPKMVVGDIAPRGLVLREAGLKGERGLRSPGEGCVPLGATCHDDGRVVGDFKYLS